MSLFYHIVSSVMRKITCRGKKGGGGREGLESQAGFSESQICNS